MKEADIEATSENCRLKLAAWWARPYSKTSLRLTAEGFDFLSNTINIEHFSFTIPPFSSTLKVDLQLDKLLSCPFYMPTIKNIILFGSTDATMLVLLDNNLYKYLDNLAS